MTADDSVDGASSSVLLVGLGDPVSDILVRLDDPSLAARVEDAPAARGVGGGCERITREEAVAIVAKRRGRAAPGETVCAQNGVKSQEPAGTTPPVRDAAQPGQKRLKVSDADSNTIEALLCLRETNGTSDKQRGS